MTTEQKREVIEKEILEHIGQGSTPLANLVQHITVDKKLTDHVALVGEVVSDMFNRGLLKTGGFYPHPFDNRDLDVRIITAPDNSVPIKSSRKLHPAGCICFSCSY